ILLGLPRSRKRDGSDGPRWSALRKADRDQVGIADRARARIGAESNQADRHRSEQLADIGCANRVVIVTAELQVADRGPAGSEFPRRGVELGRARRLDRIMRPADTT